LKLILPALALALIVLVIVWPQLNGANHRFQIGFSGIETREAADLAMVNARFTGVDSQNRPFSITADLARNLTPSAERVDLEMPKADITLKDGTWLVVTADTGRYEQASRTLVLKGAVDLFHDSGYEIRTSVAHVDFAAGQAWGDAPVTGHGPFGQLQSEGFRALDNADVIKFTGKAHAVLYPESQGR
jgi:lipopolysaccharide export system protein LptC